MPAPQLLVAWLATFAAVSGLGLLYDIDDVTRALAGFVSALSWALVSFSAYSIRMQSTVDPDLATDAAYLPLVYLAVGMAFVTALFAIRRLLLALASETVGGDEMGMLD